MIKFIKKRDGSLEAFDKNKILYAVERAFFEVRPNQMKMAKKITEEAIHILQHAIMKGKVEEIPTVEDVQDAVEQALKKTKDVLAAYRDYRNKKTKARLFMKELGISDAKITLNAIVVLEERYLLRDKNGNIIETPAQLFKRVASHVASAEKKYNGDVTKIEKIFYNMMARSEFLPNSPTLFNAGTPKGQLSACFVLPVNDSLESIFTAVKQMALIEQTGGGVGFSFSNLRPKGDIVKSTKGVASGPCSFMRIFDVATDVIKAGGKRRGALIGILRVDHPDIMSFINAKMPINGQYYLSNFNISVAITNKFMDAVKKNRLYPLINPRNGAIVRYEKARKVWDAIINAAWRTGDPGVIFIDEINKMNPLSDLGKIESTNPCGEIPLYPYESCNLGSINLVRMLKKEGDKYEIDWNKLGETVDYAVRFLDDIIDVNSYPLPEIEQATKANRKIGLGVMGFADMLLLLGVSYNSKKALKIAERLMVFIEERSHKASQELGRERGSFPNFEKSKWKKIGYKTMRNATVTAIAPTGTISIIAGVSSGIEPLFAVAFVRDVLGGRRLLEINPIFERIAKENGFYSTSLMMEIAKTGSIQHIKRIPKRIRELFLTAHEIPLSQHVKMQAAFQRHVDNSVSKTINLPHDASPKDVRKAYEWAYKLKCKGVTVYRYGSKPEQVLYFIQKAKKKFAGAHSDYAGGCPTRYCLIS